MSIFGASPGNLQRGFPGSTRGADRLVSRQKSRQSPCGSAGAGFRPDRFAGRGGTLSDSNGSIATLAPSPPALPTPVDLSTNRSESTYPLLPPMGHGRCRPLRQSVALVGSLPEPEDLDSRLRDIRFARQQHSRTRPKPVILTRSGGNGVRSIGKNKGKLPESRRSKASPTRSRSSFPNDPDNWPVPWRLARGSRADEDDPAGDDDDGDEWKRVSDEDEREEWME